MAEYFCVSDYNNFRELHHGNESREDHAKGVVEDDQAGGEVQELRSQLYRQIKSLIY